ncbi:hypothetical protein LG299_07735 [Microbacterium lacus]|uniref:hypothetical protein n=1 Tax=Microbacterium lacus TaxID=415217 RepID=UPI0038515C8C
MPRPPRPLPEGLGETFLRADALAAGVSARRLRAKDLESPFHGVRQTLDASTPTLGTITAAESLDGEEPLARDRMQRRSVLRAATAYTAVMADRAFFTSRTAAVIYGLPLSHTDALDVGVCGPSTAPRGRSIRGFKVQPGLISVREHNGLRMSSPASTWAMLGRELSVRELITVGDAIVRIPRDTIGRLRADEQLASVEHLRRAAHAGSRPGVAKLREAVELVRVGSSSPLETEFRLDALADRLPEPELDVEIRDGRGSLLGITEISYAEFRTLVEIEGDHHRTTKRQWDRDIEKYAAYAAEGWEVVRLTSRHIRGEGPRASGMVATVLVRRGWRPETRA